MKCSSRLSPNTQLVFRQGYDLLELAFDTDSRQSIPQLNDLGAQFYKSIDFYRILKRYGSLDADLVEFETLKAEAVAQGREFPAKLPMIDFKVAASPQILDTLERGLKSLKSLRLNSATWNTYL